MTERLVAHILIGLPGSGKSTLARRLAAIHNPATIVSSDEIRKHLYGDESIQGSNAQVFRQAERELFAALRAGRSVIYDATNINQRFRRMTLRELRQAGAAWIIGYWLKVPMGICQERNRKRSRVVPEEVLVRMLHDLRESPPQFADGFDEIVILGKEAEICVGGKTG
jgi:predicted kinase